MGQQQITLGQNANDGNGDRPRTAGTKINDNFTELYAGVNAIDVPSTYMYHDASASLNTPLVINVPAEVDVDAVFTGNLFTNTGDGLITSSSVRPFKADVSYDLTLRVSSGNVNMRLFVRKNSVATNVGEFLLTDVQLTAHREA